MSGRELREDRSDEAAFEQRPEGSEGAPLKQLLSVFTGFKRPNIFLSLASRFQNRCLPSTNQINVQIRSHKHHA